MNKLEILKKKLLYRSNYRGTKEMDILLGKFVKKYIDVLDEINLKDLEIFLELDDEIMLNYYNFDINNDNIKKNKITTLFKNFKI